jgi:FtsP/CotA-like multicopper oxidase with cupredoxin domain
MKRRKFLLCMRLIMTGLIVLALAAAPGVLAQSGNGNSQAKTDCVIKGKHIASCTLGQMKQAAREAARLNAAPQQKGVINRFAGVSPASASLSPLATTPSTGTNPAPTGAAAPLAPMRGAAPVTMMRGAAPLGPIGPPVAPLATMAPPGAKPDYFGAGNYANSPLPQLNAAGAVIAGTGIRKFVDVLPGICGISPWMGAAGKNGLNQCLPLAQKDTSLGFAGDTVTGGSDFYRIGVNEFNIIRMHSDLPVTKLRGYTDLVADPTGADPTKYQYLGPLILATRDRPVRILFENRLPVGSKLFIPTDTTYMGAGLISDDTRSEMASQSRADLHLHGGSTPWMSDGTTHQWITPAGEPVSNALGFAKGFSAQHAPDMPGPLGIDPAALNDGKMTYFWTNQQSGRLMFFHDHAYGMTRLDVYAGEAAGYLLVDPVQESALATATAPGTIVTNPATGVIVSQDLAHIVPLVIQDKTFVPDSGIAGGQLAAQDPTWDVANWGGAGSLWFPHVYMPNQNPADVTGANGFGRWDYGPWFWPPQNSNTFVAGGMPYPCDSTAYPGGAGLAYPPLMCPGTPLPSGTPEGFMDTPVVNGTAYPKLEVAPAAYRFQVLNAANDRALNLGLYIAQPVTLSPVILSPGSGFSSPVVTIGGCTGGIAIAQMGSGTDPATGLPFDDGIVDITITTQPTACTTPTITIADTAPGTGSGATVSVVMSKNTDVKMVPAIPAAAGRTLPNCSTSKMLPMAGGGQVTALLDPATGNPLNGTGLPLNCWPLYSSAQGYTAGPFGENGGQLSWGNSDARTGGIPDPTTAGPPIIQIGTEGGVLPKVAVIPSTPVSYDYNKRSITVLNVLNHGLFLGPAERADIIVDFSAFAGKTLILYNDAPAPIPAGDPRLDYYTNDPDQSDSGGAPSTLAGYGPNMRTIMQINVTGTNPNTTPFSLSALSAAIPNIFVATQDAVIVPEKVYPAGNGGAATDTYIPIQYNSTNAWSSGPVGGVTLTNGGTGYTAVPRVNITGGGGTGATATATLSGGAVLRVNVSSSGFGYSSAPVVTFTGGGGASAAATANLGNAGVRRILITNGGSGYTSAPTISIAAPTTGTKATAIAMISGGAVVGISVSNAGTGYTSVPVVTITGGGGSNAAVTAYLGYRVTSFTVTNGGTGYTSTPTVTVAAPTSGNCIAASLCSTARGTATMTARSVTSVILTNGGTGYVSAPTVSIVSTNGVGSGATATATPPTVPLLPKTIQELFTLDYGRMNATLGVELPFTNFLTQTTIPYGYADPPTEIFKDGETQIWKITHNGVDTHFIHFHLFTVQVINRVGWDGAIKPPDPNELGFKDTVRMNPLEDIVVALRPFKQTLPWPIPNSTRPMDVTRPVGTSFPNEFTNVDPTNQPAPVTNSFINFGWEYVWHCHILGHEENDMMRAMILAVAPVVPNVPVAVLGSNATGQFITVTLTANSVAGTAVPTGFTVLRATSMSGPWTVLGTTAAVVTGTTASGTFVDTTVAPGTTYVYHAVSNNLVGYTQTYAAPAAGYPNVSADSLPSPNSNGVRTN